MDETKLTIGECAKRLGVKRDAIHKAIIRGHLNARALVATGDGPRYIGAAEARDAGIEVLRYEILESDLDAFRLTKRGKGRPRKVRDPDQ